jgi:hypothetical protein
VQHSRKPFTVHNLKERQKQTKPKRWSHQDELAERIGKNITLYFAGEQFAVGKLIAADAYTVKIEGQNGITHMTYFKSGLQGYEFTA